MRLSGARPGVKTGPAILLLFLSCAAFAQSLIVTAEGRDGKPAPDLAKDDVAAMVNNKPAAIQNWVPLRGPQAALELFIVIDDGVSAELGAQFETLKSFINALPNSTTVGLAYLRNGAAAIVAPMSVNHAGIAKALRLPLAQPGISASPYMGISDLLKRWPAAETRREVLLIASGIDPWSPPDPQNPYLQKAIADAQRAGVLIHSIYYSEAGHLGHSFWRSNWGQNYLSELGDETGGEAYWQGLGSPVSFAPYLKDLSERFNHQYVLTIAIDSSKKEQVEPLRVTTSKACVSLVAASRIYIRK